MSRSDWLRHAVGRNPALKAEQEEYEHRSLMERARRMNVDCYGHWWHDPGDLEPARSESPEPLFPERAYTDYETAIADAPHPVVINGCVTIEHVDGGWRLKAGGL